MDAKLAIGFGLLLLGVLVLPIDMLPHTTKASGRALFGALLLIFGGALMGRVLIA